MVWLSLLGAAAIGWFSWKPVARKLIQWKIGSYRVTVNTVDPARPLKLSSPKKVAVLGGGLAGIAATNTLAARGYSVTILESKPYLGGKLGSWQVEFPGSTEWVSHGFHAFFRHYYNFNRFMDSLGLRKNFKGISDYRVLRQNGGEVSFGDLESTPVLNLMALRNVGMYRYAEVTRAPTRHLMTIFLEYDPVTNARLDNMSFAEFARLAEVPPQLMIAFNTFSRAFFADEALLSMAEMLKSFHAYYLGHDGGLIYDHPTKDYEATLLKPIREHFATLNVQLRLSTPVTSLAKADGGGFVVNGEKFDKVVLATDVVGANAILGSAAGFEPLHAQFTKLRPGQRYSVLRLWLDKVPRTGLPVFVVTEKMKVLDSITFFDRTEDESAAWVKANGGSVIELHCYAVAEGMAEKDVHDLMIDELKKFLPELDGCVVRHEHFRVQRDFTAYHVGMDADRPGTDTGVDGLYCAGDWVKLPFPAMLMEGAFSSGMVAANRILASDGLREDPIESVPLKGMLAGIPESSARKKLLGFK